MEEGQDSNSQSQEKQLTRRELFSRIREKVSEVVKPPEINRNYLEENNNASQPHVLDRRDFLKIAGAGVALVAAGTAVAENFGKSQETRGSSEEYLHMIGLLEDIDNQTNLNPEWFINKSAGFAKNLMENPIPNEIDTVICDCTTLGKELHRYSAPATMLSEVLINAGYGNSDQKEVSVTASRRDSFNDEMGPVTIPDADEVEEIIREADTFMMDNLGLQVTEIDIAITPSKTSLVDDNKFRELQDMVRTSSGVNIEPYTQNKKLVSSYVRDTKISIVNNEGSVTARRDTVEAVVLISSGGGENNIKGVLAKITSTDPRFNSYQYLDPNLPSAVIVNDTSEVFQEFKDKLVPTVST